MKVKGLVFAVLASLVFASPALARGGAYIFIYIGPSGPVPVPDSRVGDYSKIHKIGILSAIGSTIDVSWHGGEPGRENASSWKRDDLVVATLKKFLGTKYELSDLPFDGWKVAAVTRQFYRERDTLNLLGTFTNPGVDAYLIVRPADGRLPGPAGLGIDVTAKNEVLLWANFEIDLIDAHNLTYLAKGYAQLQTEEGTEPAFAVQDVPISPSAAFGLQSGLKDPVAIRVQEELEDLIPNAIVSTLRSLKMGVDLPAVGDHSIAVPADTAIMANVHSVAIASAIGETLELDNPGVGFFVKKSQSHVPIVDTGIDEAAEAIARDVLARHYAVKTIPVDRTAIARTVVVPDQRLPSVVGLTRTNDVDAYVLIVKAMRPEAPYAGLGVLHITPLVNRTTSVVADYGIVVVNARTLRAVAGYAAAPPVVRPCPQTDYSHAGQASPLLDCQVDDSLWPSSADTMTPDQMVQIRKVALGLLSASIPQTLFKLGMDKPDQSPTTASSLTENTK